MESTTIYEVLGRYVDDLAMASPICLAYGSAFLNGAPLTPVGKPIKFMMFLHNSIVEGIAFWGMRERKALLVLGTPSISLEDGKILMKFQTNAGEVVLKLRGGRDMRRALEGAVSTCGHMRGLLLFAGRLPT
jgi:hypothetical protein